MVATAASTFVISGLLFFAAFRYTFKRKKIENYSGDPKLRRDGAASAAVNAFCAAGDSPRRKNPIGGTLKAVVVDENGLDVVYFRDEGRTKRRCNHCKQVVDSPPGPGRQKKPQAQASPLLQDDSLNSSDRIKEMISVTSNGSSESITLAPNVDPPPLPLPPARRGSSSSSSSSYPHAAAPPTSRPPVPTLPPRGPAPSPAPPSDKGGAEKKPGPQPPAAPASMGSVNAAPSSKGPAPAPPPPRAPAPPPPAPPHAPARGPAPPPPPPAIGGGPGKKPGPPPPPGLGSKKPPAPVKSTAEQTQEPKLKPLHWDKMTTVNTEHSMVWDKIHGGSFRFDDELMVALFGNVAVNQKPAPGNTNSSSSTSNPNQICLLDSRKSQNTAIVLRSLAVSRAEILDSLLEGRGLSADILEKLSKLGITKEEEETILGFSGNPSSLADAESFLFHLLKEIPSAFTRVDAMLFKATYEPEILHLKDSLRTLEAACREMRKQGLFMRMLEAVLKAGNRMNAGTARGNAQAFNLSSLRKLSDVKSTDGKTTLLHFVVESVVRSEGKRCVLNRNQSFGRSMSRSASGLSAANREEKSMEYLTLGLPVVGGLSMEYANVKKAASIEPEALLSTCTLLRTRVEKMKNMVSSCGDSNGGFAREIRVFLERAEKEVEAVMEEQNKVLEEVKQTTEYYIVGSSKDKNAHPQQLFIIVKDFLATVDQTCVDIARNLQQKKRKAPVSTGESAAPEKKTPTRFANLPPRFLKDNSRSSMTDSGSDSEDEF